MRSNAFKALIQTLEPKGVQVEFDHKAISFKTGNKKLQYLISAEDFDFEKHQSVPVLPLDYILNEPEKTAAAILSRLGLNEKIFARKCEVKKTDKNEAQIFLDENHLMKSTQSAFNYGLYHNNELIALASFSKGRRMDRLPAEKRSYELIRFCCKKGVTVTGGLTKLLKFFCEEKKAGDVMTYVDKQWSDGTAFVKAGFKKLGETDVNYFLVDRKNFKREYLHQGDPFDSKKHYLSQNKGNIKLIYTPGDI
ncbi:MAG: hypothetical protein JNL60_15670 [Bacteroidia bacterium]|nr:hypothetical protein [Bacteroidia bacterium]